MGLSLSSNQEMHIITDAYSVLVCCEYRASAQQYGIRFTGLLNFCAETFEILLTAFANSPRVFYEFCAQILSTFRAIFCGVSVMYHHASIVSHSIQCIVVIVCVSQHLVA